MDDLAELVKKGEMNFDVVIASPDAMRVVDREFQRRTKAAEAVGALLTALTDVERVDRQAELLRALEQSTRARKARRWRNWGAAGLPGKRQGWNQSGLGHGASVQRARLELLSLCAPGRVNSLDDFVMPYIDRRRR